jgi:HK97 gp10 family phage protein
MARLTIKTTADFWVKLQRLADNADDIAKKAIYEGAGIMADEIRARLEQNLADPTYLGSKAGVDVKNVGYTATGGMADALGVTKIQKKGTGGNWNAHIGWDGYENGDKSRAYQLLANAMESGTSTMRARPFIKPAVEAKRTAVEDKMNEIIDDEFEKILK